MTDHIHYQDQHGTNIGWVEVTGDNDEDGTHATVRKFGWTPQHICHQKCDYPEITKSVRNLNDPNPTDAEHVYNYLLQNYPPKSIAWVRKTHWIGPVQIPHDRIDYGDEKNWAASKQPQTVNKFAEEIKNNSGHLNPVIMVQTPHDDRAKIVDGHHRTLAYKKLGKPVKAYVGTPHDNQWEETHSSQFHSGNDPQNKGE